MGDIVKNSMDLLPYKLKVRFRNENSRKQTNMDKHTSQELIKTRKAVREKYKKLKSDLAATEINLERTYKPIIQPLKQLITKYDHLELAEPKQEIKDEFKQEYFPFISTPKKSPKKYIQTGQTPQLPIEMPSFFGDSRYDSVLANTAREIQFQDTSVIAQSDEPSQHESSEEKTPTATLEDLINQTREVILQYVDKPGYKDYLEDFEELPRQYIDSNIRDTENNFDHKYGVVHDFAENKFSLGLTQEAIDFQGKDILIKNIKYPGTVGLYELLFKKEPLGYNGKDLDNYMDILHRTNAYLDETGNVSSSSNRYAKFRKIILPYLHKKGITKKGAKALTEVEGYTSNTSFARPPPPSRTRPTTSRITRQNTKLGKGLTLKNNNKNTDFIFWDDPNEIVDRLRLLMSSTAAGHNAHTNEIISIIEELREAQLIQ